MAFFQIKINTSEDRSEHNSMEPSAKDAENIEKLAELNRVINVDEIADAKMNKNTETEDNIKKMVQEENASEISSSNVESETATIIGEKYSVQVAPFCNQMQEIMKKIRERPKKDIKMRGKKRGRPRKYETKKVGNSQENEDGEEKKKADEPLAVTASSPSLVPSPAQLVRIVSWLN